MSKNWGQGPTDLKARPVYHRQQQKIEAHLTVVLCAFAVSRHVQEVTGVSIKRFVKMLARVQDGVIEIDGVEHPVPAGVPAEVSESVGRLDGFGAWH